MTKFNIEITSDTVCPWCYVGSKKLDKAIETYKQKHPESNDTFATTWKPFYLIPNAPTQGIDKTSYYRSRYGDEMTTESFARLSQIGKELGINFKFGGKTGNTRDSHRLVQLGKTKSATMQTRVVEELATAYFENEQDITSHEVLLKAAKKAGLEEKEAKEWLESGKGGKEVDAEVEEAYEKQITGVPRFEIQGKFLVGGAQEPEVFLRLFEKIKATEVAAKA